MKKMSAIIAIAIAIAIVLVNYLPIPQYLKDFVLGVLLLVCILKALFWYQDAKRHFIQSGETFDR
jgi:4-amino-4-deoxy-L-arabinose transferase-like glycosyltransferase